MYVCVIYRYICIYTILRMCRSPHPIQTRQAASFSPSGSLAWTPTTRPIYLSMYLSIYPAIYICLIIGLTLCVSPPPSSSECDPKQTLTYAHRRWKIHHRVGFACGCRQLSRSAQRTAVSICPSIVCLILHYISTPPPHPTQTASFSPSRFCVWVPTTPPFCATYSRGARIYILYNKCTVRHSINCMGCDL